MPRKIILASKSPRRAELMKMAGFEFTVDSKNVEETHPEGVPTEQIPECLAKEKARAFLSELQGDEVVIGADTIVILNGRIYEKPKDRQDAIDMLLTLSGQKHEVITGVCLLTRDSEITFSEKTAVFFNELTQPEVEYYVDTFKPYDKAGSYACQEWIGAIAISRFEGDYFNVVGLPVNRVYKELKKLL